LPSAYNALGVDVVLVSSRDRVLPGEDAQAATVLEDVLTRRGMTVLSKRRANAATRAGDTVTVTLSDGSTAEGSHCLLAVGSIPNTSGIGLEEAGIQLDGGGFAIVDRVSRTSVRGVYAAGDCTGVLMLASVAAMQGRIAMRHALGDAVKPPQPQVRLSERVHGARDRHSGWHDLEVVERGLPPPQELVSLLVPLVLQLDVALERIRRAEYVRHYRVIDHEFRRRQWVDLGWITTEINHCLAHRGQIYDRRDTREVLHDYPRRRELDFRFRFRVRVPGSERSDVVGGCVIPVLGAQQVLEQDLQAVRQPLMPLDCTQPIELVRGVADLQGAGTAEAVRMMLARHRWLLSTATFCPRHKPKAR
jgi:Pyridine nucleotide-disulphide oxidoreductase